MGQYHLTVNLDKKEFLDPHTLGNGLKLIEQASNPNPGIPAALFVLLACANGRGGGDLSPNPIVGRWAGDRIAVVGDYSEPSDIDGYDASRIYEQCRSSYRYLEPESTSVQHIEDGDLFYGKDQWHLGMWERICRIIANDTILVCNIQTRREIQLMPTAPVEVLGRHSAEWADLSWTVSRFLETELGGQYRGTGVRRWHDNDEAVA